MCASLSHPRLWYEVDMMYWRRYLCKIMTFSNCEFSNPPCGQLWIFCPRSRLRLRFYETGSAVPSRVSPLILGIEAKSSIIDHQSSIINLVLTPAFRVMPSLAIICSFFSFCRTRLDNVFFHLFILFSFRRMSSVGGAARLPVSLFCFLFPV